MAATTEEPPELTELIHDIGERAQKTSDDVQDAIDYVSDIKEKLQELCCKNNSSQSGSGTGAGAGAGAGAAVGTIVGVAVAAVIIVSVIITLSVLLTMPSGNSSTNTTSLNDTNTTGAPSYGTAPTLTSLLSRTPISTGTAPTLTSQTPISTGTAPTLTSQLTQTPISTGTAPTLISQTHISTDTAPTLTSQTPISTGTAPTLTSQLAQTPISTGTAPALTLQTPISTGTIPTLTSQTPISTGTVPTLTSQLTQTPISTGTAPTLSSQTPISTGTAPTLTSQTPISTGTAPTLTSQLTQTPISTGTAPTLTSQTPISSGTAPTLTVHLLRTPISTRFTEHGSTLQNTDSSTIIDTSSSSMLTQATFSPVTRTTIPFPTVPRTTQSLTTMPFPTVPRTSSSLSTVFSHTTQSLTTMPLPTLPPITTTVLMTTEETVTQSPCNVLTVDENSRVEVLEPIPTMSAVTACIRARTVEVSGGTPLSYSTAASDNEFFLSFPENLRVGIRGATTGATGISVNDGAWHHVCVTWNSVGGIFNIYDNGVLAFGDSNFRTGLMIRSGGVFILGQEQDTLGGGFDPAQAFKGDLANFNLWDRELEGVDILNSTHDCSCDIEGNVFSWKSDSLDITGTALVSAIDFCPQPSLTNVALDKNATQSSDWSVSFPASNAVDGNTNTHWVSGSCTSTLSDINAWWKVDLGENYLVYEVILTNRLDPCCKTRILNSEVRIGVSDVISENIRCGELVTLEQTSQSDIVFECDSPIVGRYASLQLVDRTDLLNFCEMQVMAIENIALNGIASQSSTASGGLPVRAIDGNDSSTYSQGSCMHTLKELNSWWKVDLETTYDIFKVVITNRGDCCEDRIDGAVVLIGENADISQNHQCGVQIDWNSNTYEERIPFDCQLSGRYVGVQLKDHNNWLTLCEVEVYGS